MNDKVRGSDTPPPPPSSRPESTGYPNLSEIMTAYNLRGPEPKSPADAVRTEARDTAAGASTSREQSPKDRILSDWVKGRKDDIARILDSKAMSPSGRVAALEKLLKVDGIPEMMEQAAKESSPQRPTTPEKSSGPSIDRARPGQGDDVRAFRIHELKQWQIKERPTAYDVMAADMHRLGRALDPAGAGGVGAGTYGVARVLGMDEAGATALAAKAEVVFQVVAMYGELSAAGHRTGEAPGGKSDRAPRDAIKVEAPLGPWKPEVPRLGEVRVEPIGESWGERFEPLGRDRVAPGAHMAVPKTESVDYFAGGRRDQAKVVLEQKDGSPILVQVETWKGCDLYQQQAQDTLNPNVAAAVKSKVESFAQRWYDQKWLGGSPDFKGPRSQPIDDGHGPLAVRQNFTDPFKYVVVVYLTEAQVTPELQKQAQDALSKAVADAVSMHDPRGKPLPPIEAVIVGQNGTQTQILRPDPTFVLRTR